MPKILGRFKFNFYYIGIFALCSSFSTKLVRADCDWICDNGDCIDSEYVCDGAVQCRDGSDEIIDNCYGNATCPSYAFRCSYGACVAGTDKCNGRKDCADNSDEEPLLCERNRDRIEQILQNRCAELQMQCDSGECIDSELMCDGNRDCKDSSDERLATCSHLTCAPFAFRCAYGACIDGKATCNGTTECHDGSDEASALCGTPRKRGSSVTDRPLKTTRPTTIIKRPTTSITTAQCIVPIDRSNIVITDRLKKRRLQTGTSVPVNTVLSFQCEPGYTRVGVNTTICEDYGWDSDIPICTKYCDDQKVTYGVSTQATCYFGDESVPCKHIKVGTIAKISCATGFYKEQSLTSDIFYNELHCVDQYRWDHTKTPCKMRCGYVQPAVVPFTKNGTPVNITDVPWHVGIYSHHKENKYERVCGGSIISPRIVISAAHCFWDEANLEIYDASYYSVAAGKYFTDYDSTEEYFPVQKSTIKQIFVENYEDRSGNYDKDLAILQLHQHFKFTHSVSPICVNFDDRAQASVADDKEGFIAGWGPNAQGNREVLQRVDMLTRSYSSCVNDLRGYALPTDKFCVKRATSRGDICKGDSGGAFVIRERGANYRLIGVVSHAPLSKQDCGLDGVVALTNINFFEKTIKRFAAEDIDRRL